MSRSALFLYSSLTGNGVLFSRLPRIKEELGTIFDHLEAKDCESEQDIDEAVKDAVGKFDSLIFAGGDGTFNRVASCLAEVDNPPTLGYINAGTLGDVGRNFGIGRNYKKALKIIEDGYSMAFDLGKINDAYFVYMAAAGAYSDIAYSAKRKNKKKHGRFAYYRLAIKEAFQKTRFEYRVNENPAKTTPFLMFLNGKKVGGFSVNPKSKINDGQIEFYQTKCGAFNGLLHYFFHSKGMKTTIADPIRIECPPSTQWCIDGEKGPMGSVMVSVLPSRLRIYCSKKTGSKLD